MDLGTLLASLKVVRRGEWIYTANKAVPGDVPVLATVTEAEGITRIVDASCARELGLEDEPVFTCLTLDVHSALESVGLTKTVSAALADAGISCNVIAGFYHDHLLVPAARAEEAEQLLTRL
ncbi:MAG: ACT domain-containing protein [Actinomycetaceae bacterium]|nr:ACT domain-containing protein [Actinomycetaceae bacterium]